MKTLLRFFGIKVCVHPLQGMGMSRKGRRGVICFKCGKFLGNGRWLLCAPGIAPSLLDRRGE